MTLRYREDDDAADERNAATTASRDHRRSKADILVETGLTPKEYILAEVEANGGRMKQQSICEVAGWSDGTVSELLSEMEADGTIDRFRLGPGKVVSLPELRSETRPGGE